MRISNGTIDELELLEIPLANGKFTWSKMGNDSKQSLIDQFLVTKEWSSLFINSRVSRAERVTSNHYPILLEAGDFKWGPSPFRFFDSCLSDKDCRSLVELKLAEEKSYGWAGFTSSSKLQNLKFPLKSWHFQKEKKRKEMELQIIESISSLDKKDESHGLSEEKEKRCYLKNYQQSIYFTEKGNLIQK